MNSMNARVEYATSASELRASGNAWPLTTIMEPALFAVSSADPATKYLVTFEMTIKPLPEEPSTFVNHPPTDGSER